MSAQRYTNPVALERMANNTCPECGSPADDHTSWGSARCSLTDTGVDNRIEQYRNDLAAEGLGE